MKKYNLISSPIVIRLVDEFGGLPLGEVEEQLETLVVMGILYDEERDEVLERLNGNRQGTMLNINANQMGVLEVAVFAGAPRYYDGDLLCNVCGEPWDRYGVMSATDMDDEEKRLFLAGIGCPICRGEESDLVKGIKQRLGLVDTSKSGCQVVRRKDGYWVNVAGHLIKNAVIMECKKADEEKHGYKWCVYSEKGKLLGGGVTREEAEIRLRQIEYFKHKSNKNLTLQKITQD